MRHRTDPLLMISTFSDDDDSGGLFILDGDRLEQVDRAPGTGLARAGDLLFRLLRSPSLATASGEVLVYDRTGVRQYLRLDGVADGHDVLYFEDSLVVAAPATNSIFWLDLTGGIRRVWKAPGNGDCWHVNGLAVKDGVLYASAFGRFSEHRGWDRPGVRERAGIIFDVSTGRDVIRDLDCPHQPRFIDQMWVVCNSLRSELVGFDPTGTLLRRLQLSSWTRGLAALGDFLYVGESKSRKASATQGASVAIVDRVTWQVIERILVPAREIFDILPVERSFVDAARVGFRTNALRYGHALPGLPLAAPDDALLRVRASGEPLPAEACIVRIFGHTPDAVEPGSHFIVDAEIQNLGSRTLASMLPNPTHVSYRWFRAGTVVPLSDAEPIRTRLPFALGRGQSVRVRVPIDAPTAAGDYLLRLTLVQEFVAWFDDINAENGFTRLVHVVLHQTAQPDTGSPSTGFAVWLTGLPAAGKTTLSRELVVELQRRGRRSRMLDGDEIRAELSPDLGFSRADRELHIRRVAFIAKVLSEDGGVPVVALISPYRSARAEARAAIGRFVEVYVSCPMDELERRDPKGLYRAAREGLINNLTGVNDAYEPPDEPEVTVQTDRETPAEGVAAIVRYLETAGYLEG